MRNAPQPLTVAFLLASYTPDAPAGMERATAGLAEGLRRLGHRVVILTTAAQPVHDRDVGRLTSVAPVFPCDDRTLRHVLDTTSDDLGREITTLFDTLGVDVAVYVDALWGLGRVAPRHRARCVLAVHVLGHHVDLQAAMARADHVFAPSACVLDQAAHAGYDPTRWSIVPNPLLHEHPPPDAVTREALRLHGAIRVLGRLGPEKNIAALLGTVPVGERPVEVMVADAGFETTAGGQRAEWSRCAQAAEGNPHIRLSDGGVSWQRVPAWLAEAAVVIVPSVCESFGLVALEAMSVGTPVVAFDIGNLPALIGTGSDAGGVLVPRSRGERGLWEAADTLLHDHRYYQRHSRAAYYRSRDYLPTTVAKLFVKAVR